MFYNYIFSFSFFHFKPLPNFNSIYKLKGPQNFYPLKIKKVNKKATKDKNKC